MNFVFVLYLYFVFVLLFLSFSFSPYIQSIYKSCKDRNRIKTDDNTSDSVATIDIVSSLHL